ncbi:hypothetical protein [Desulfovibrio gilichinskyi]|uniref:Uncharacterized protein n=1 Tax=Desulfovibrio gilichinskyi TaxID=1519643 RepID=A0A1X7C0Q7_9BACT|nr:hypothetical protein [Desulfovibrio gilichinskyi]SME87909.1 hypothetical protein SAMN06295933_0077 [Desulfovibrio gilichinskyi]
MESNEKKESLFVFENGTTYFSKRTERRILFIMTLIMLGWGMVEGLNRFLG